MEIEIMALPVAVLIAAGHLVFIDIGLQSVKEQRDDFIILMPMVLIPCLIGYYKGIYIFL